MLLFSIVMVDPVPCQRDVLVLSESCHVGAGQAQLVKRAFLSLCLRASFVDTVLVLVQYQYSLATARSHRQYSPQADFTTRAPLSAKQRSNRLTIPSLSLSQPRHGELAAQRPIHLLLLMLYSPTELTGSTKTIFTLPLCVFASFSTVISTTTLSNTATATSPFGEGMAME
jgi:hypothetical protein